MLGRILLADVVALRMFTSVGLPEAKSVSGLLVGSLPDGATLSIRRPCLGGLQAEDEGPVITKSVVMPYTLDLMEDDHHIFGGVTCTNSDWQA